MLSLILQTAQQAKQVAPNVYVTTQQPPGGMPEWVKIVISAAVGALFGIAGSVVMEFVKPKILNADLKRTVAFQLSWELDTNMRKIKGLSTALSEFPTPESWKLCQEVLTTTAGLKWDR
jgi:hypothetical protein